MPDWARVAMPDWAKRAKPWAKITMLDWSVINMPDRQRLGKLARDGLAVAWPLLQVAAAATVAWLIATRLGGRENPFFAPVAALVALTITQGERGWAAFRLVYGVVVGILIGELAALVMGTSYLSLAVATFVALLVPVILGADRLVRIQSAAGAILTVVAAGGDAGLGRLIDGLVGTGVALLFTQVLFPPEPVALVRRAESTALNGLADGLELAADAIERNDEGMAEDAISRLRGMREDLLEVGNMKEASARVASRSAIWWFRRGVTAREGENAGQLDLLGASCLMLMRTILGADTAERPRLAPSVRELSRVLHDLATDLGDRRVRQEAVDRVRDVLLHPVAGEPGQVSMVAAAASIRMVAYDLLVFAGVEVEDALDLVQEGSGTQHVVTPPPSFRLRIRRPRLLFPRRLWRQSQRRLRRRPRQRGSDRPR